MQTEAFLYQEPAVAILGKNTSLDTAKDMTIPSLLIDNRDSHKRKRAYTDSINLPSNRNEALGIFFDDEAHTNHGPGVAQSYCLDFGRYRDKTLDEVPSGY